MDSTWLAWAKQLQAIAQNGLHYARDPYDVDRYEAVRAIAAEIMEKHSDADQAHIRGLFAQEKGHITPKADVRGAVFRDDTLLLVREKQDGLWTLPGGWADPGEPASMAVVREVWEESGYRTRATKLLAFYDHERHDHPPSLYSIYTAIFLCALRDEADPVPVAPTHTSAAHQEILAVDFFRADEIPPLSLPRVRSAQIARIFAHRQHPDWPTDFD